ncbi:uncharacterized protein LOC132560201 [Ylistrum balloti]|uniref:uncharacterized protein LOC132560201 n=1 Tax=Ylistrum balloti TaxID=509963 RepID=UPI002905D92D|nr:uncharacterized protein LOC132560201 [Ylistrum balloti]
MAGTVWVFMLLLISGYITDTMCVDLMPKPKDCKNNFSEKKCARILKNRYKDNIYDMCFGYKTVDECCAFCLNKLTCDNSNPYNNDIIDMATKFMYLTVDCKDTMKYSQCMDIRDKAYGKNTKAMCKDEKYAGMCCRFCKYGMGKDWSSLVMDEWMKHPYKKMQNILDNFGGYGQGDQDDDKFYDSIYNFLDGFDNNDGKRGKEDGDFGDFINNIIKGNDGYGDKKDKNDYLRMKSAPFSLTKAGNMAESHLRKRRDAESENMCEDRIGADNCRRMMMRSPYYKHGGMPHIFCSNPHNVISCCRFCASASANRVDNRKRRDLAFLGKGEYPKEGTEETCDGDRLSPNRCRQIVYSMFKGSKKDMCTSIHFGNVCCDTCRKFLK